MRSDFPNFFIARFKKLVSFCRKFSIYVLLTTLCMQTDSPKISTMKYFCCLKDLIA